MKTPQVALQYQDKSNVEDTIQAFPLVKSKWPGPLGIYPEAGRRDYLQAFADPNVENPHSTDEYVKIARDWVVNGVQVIGGCCGIGLNYIVLTSNGGCAWPGF